MKKLKQINRVQSASIPCYDKKSGLDGTIIGIDWENEQYIVYFGTHERRYDFFDENLLRWE